MVVPKYTFTTLKKDLDKLLARACFFLIRFYNLISMFVLLLDFEMNEFGV